MEEDPEAFCCETCPVREWQDKLGESEREALRIYGLLKRPGVRELQLAPLVWDALGWHGTRDEALALVEHLALLTEYDLRRRVSVATEDSDGG